MTKAFGEKTHTVTNEAGGLVGTVYYDNDYDVVLEEFPIGVSKIIGTKVAEFPDVACIQFISIEGEEDPTASLEACLSSLEKKMLVESVNAMLIILDVQDMPFFETVGFKEECKLNEINKTLMYKVIN